MKRRDLLKHLRQHGCDRLREGGNHSWWYHLDTNKRTAVPRHNEIDHGLARKICRDLGVPEIEQRKIYKSYCFSKLSVETSSSTSEPLVAQAG
jgi:predicted RNA binding protein YcfA (HicA-like mRNA interferase family)